MKIAFSLQQYIHGLKRLRTAGVITALLSLAMNTLCIVQAQGYADTLVITAAEFLYGGLCLSLLAPLLSYSMFSYLHGRSSSDFYHALPHKRSTVYISHTLALLTWIYGILLVNLGVSSLGFFVFRDFIFVGEVFYGTLAYHAASSLLLAGCGCLAVMLTGRAISALYTAGMLFSLPAVALLCFEKLLFHLYPCVNKENSLLKLLSMENSLLFNPYDLKRTADERTYVVLALAVLCFVLAGICYVRRQSEWAEKHSSKGTFRNLQRCMLPFMFTLVGMYYIVADDSAENGITFMVLAVLLLFVYELFLTKRVKSAVKALPWMLVVWVLSSALVGTAYFTADTLRSNDPKSVSEVESVTINSIYDKELFYFKPIENIKDAEVISWVIEEMENDKPYRSTKSTVVIKLRNGKTLIRMAELSNAEALRSYMLGVPEINKQIHPLPQVASPQNEKQKELWEIFTEEYYALPFGTRSWLSSRSGGKGSASFSVEVFNYAGDVVTQTYIIDSANTPKTYRFLLENGMWDDIWW